MRNYRNWRGFICGITGAIALFASTNSAFAVSAGCTAHNITQITGVLVGFPLVNRNFNSLGVFEAGEVISFSAAHDPGQVVNITNFKITETTTTTNILNAAGNTGAAYTIPANGNYSFEVKISATNPGPNAGVINYTRSCVAGVVVPPLSPPATGGGATTTSMTTGSSGNPFALLQESSRNTQEAFARMVLQNLDQSNVEFKTGMSHAAQLLANGPTIKLDFQTTKEEKEQAAELQRQEDIRKLKEEIKKTKDDLKKLKDTTDFDLRNKYQEFREKELQRELDDPSLVFRRPSERINSEEDFILFKKRQLINDIGFSSERLKSQEKSLFILENPLHDVQNEVDGVVSLPYAPVKPRSNVAANAITNSNAFRLSGSNKNAAFDLSVLSAFAASSTRGLRQKRDDLDIWLTGRFTILGDSSAANRDGYLGNISAGIAKKITDKFAVSAEAIARFGQLKVNVSNSTTDVFTGGVAVSGVVALTKTIQAGVSGSWEHGWFDSNFAGATGSYDTDTYAISGFLGGNFDVGELTLQPSANIVYSFSDISGYTDSKGVVVRSQSTEFGQAGTGLTVSKKIGGRGKLFYWQPYLNGQVNFAFQQNSSFQLRPGLLINDGQFNGSVGVGAQFNFTNGMTGTLGASYYSTFGSGLNSINLAARLTIPLN